MGCKACGETTQTNRVNIVLADGVSVPWMELCKLVSTSKPEKQPNAGGYVVEEDGVLKQEYVIEGLDDRLQSFKVIPNEGESENPNFPHNLYNAMELLIHIDHKSTAWRLQQTTNKFLQVLEEGPDGGSNRKGTGHVCFDCGHVGLSGEPPEKGQTPEKSCFCANCGDSTHTNAIKLVLPNGLEMPWLERIGEANKASITRKVLTTHQKPASGSARVKPNDPCPCGSGKKSKKCCYVGGIK